MVVIGVHTPEFRFEKNIDNVRREAKALHVDYPVAVDSEYVIWRAFNNNYWPALYFIDAQAPALSFRGGLYDSRRWSFSACSPGLAASAMTLCRLTRAVSNWVPIGQESPENYVGYERTEGFASPHGAVRDKPQMYEVPAQLRLNN